MQRLGCWVLMFWMLLPGWAADLVWTNLAGGSWASAANWSPNKVPTATDNAFITNQGSFTVTLGINGAVSNLFLGAGPGSVSNRLDQNATLAVHGTARVLTNGWFRMSGQLSVSNAFRNGGYFQWLDSAMRGLGSFVNESGGYLQTRATGVSTLGVRSFDNFGRFLVANDDAGVQFASNSGFTNEPGGVVELNLPGFGMRDATSATGTGFINRGTVRATASVPSGPSYLTVPLVNFGTLSLETASWYIGAGTNFGVITTTKATHGLSTADADPFVFEAGTSFTSPAPRLFAGGHFVFNTPLNLDSAVLHVGDASDGASTAAPRLTIKADLNFSGAVDVTSGRIEITNPALQVVLGRLGMSDDGVIGNANPYITNSAALAVNVYAQSFATIDNAGTFTVRSNLVYNGGAIRTAGVLLLDSGLVGTIGGTTAKSINGQIVTNRGTVTANAGVTFVNGGSWVNEADAVLNSQGGSFDDTGTAGSFLNRGTVQRTATVAAGGIDLVFTNAGGLVSLQQGTLSIGRFTQTAGRTELRGGNLGGTLFLRGGSLDGAGDVGTLVNSASVLPGIGLGAIRATGNITNLPAGTVHLQVGGTTTPQFDRLNTAGTAVLDGTLRLTLTNGFFPVIGNTFTAMTWNVRIGSFAKIEMPDYQFEATYLANALVLRASNAVPVVTLTAEGGDSQLVCRPFEITASATDRDGRVMGLTLLVNGAAVASGPGGLLTTRYETDFPGEAHIEARATDDRGGLGTTTRTVSVVVPPLHQLSLGGVRSNGFKICMLGEPEAAYAIRASTNLDLPPEQWVSLGLMDGSGGVQRFFDPGAITNQPFRFYRAERDRRVSKSLTSETRQRRNEARGVLSE